MYIEIEETHIYTHMYTALLRRGHDEYMKDESQRTEEDRRNLLQWAAKCQVSACMQALV